ncbi:HAD-IC family P-type ATPase [Pseudolysinimonas yzui]|uniref:Magnesium-transporting ATPase n=1 Tax=Pseudolysinimonas yzui TaxID=2708254 RepID=A0A8J3M3C7_9MICO|nr:HAD-IC family P-type ATPase [Pseudolysinimonas yzui]GHF22088.1 magnesium-transporting ATPase [Pseudolysinimonas yzui]
MNRLPPASAGLSTAEAAERLAAGLGNGYHPPVSRALVDILRANLLTLFNLIVGGAFTLLLVLGYWQDAMFGVFVIANVTIGIVQEVRAKRTLDRLTVLTAPGARVLRDGSVRTVPVTDVVLDDILVLGAGDELVADAVVLETTGLGIDESLLTGEAEAVNAEPGRELLSGSFVIGGQGLARVTRVGADSYANRVASDLRSYTLVHSELRRGLARVIRWISWILLPVALLVFNGQLQALGGWQHAFSTGTWREGALLTVAGIVSMVPQGLVFMTSVALAVGALTLTRRRVLVQELPAVEVLARVDALCFDKTGTLTDGSIVLREVSPIEERPGWAAVLAWFGEQAGANATARALRERFTGAPEEAPERTVGFSSSFRWSAASFAAGPAAGAWVLGAPDTLLPPGSPVRGRAEISAVAGRRTLVLTHRARPLTADEDAGGPPPDGLSPVALLEFQEHLRPDAADTVAYFHAEGVRLWVLSGDHPATVAAIAREAGIADGDGYDATRLPEDPAELDAVLETHSVFGRVRPDQKNLMIQALRARGRVVAMTGDGINDAPALKHADLGIAMGSGAAITRAAADVILLDGQFAELPLVVAEGRRVIANVERLAKLFLTKTVYAVAFAVLFGSLLWPYPFLPRQLSAVDGLTIGLPALVLALLPDTSRYREGFLARAARFCIPSGLVVAATVAVVVLVLRASGRDAEVPSAAVITLTLVGLWVLAILSRPLDLPRLLVVIAGYLGLGILFAVPLVTDFFAIALPSPGSLVVALGAAAAGTLTLELIHRLTKPPRPAG